MCGLQPETTHYKALKAILQNISAPMLLSFYRCRCGLHTLHERGKLAPISSWPDLRGTTTPPPICVSRVVSTFATLKKITLRQHLVQIRGNLPQKSRWPNLGGPTRAPLPPAIHVDTHLLKCGQSRAWFGPNRVNFVSPCSTTATSVSSQRRPLTTQATKLTRGKVLYKTRG